LEATTTRRDCVRIPRRNLPRGVACAAARGAFAANADSADDAAPKKSRAAVACSAPLRVQAPSDGRTGTRRRIYKARGLRLLIAVQAFPGRRP
jgi:hypothetical protein